MQFQKFSRKFFRHYRCRNEGVSFFITFTLSFFVMSFAVILISAVSSSNDQAESIERSSHFFYAAESGIEAGLFHKNSRGPGYTASSELFLSQIPAKTEWRLVSSASATSADNTTIPPTIAAPAKFNDILPEISEVRIPFSFDQAKETQTSKSIIEQTPTDTNIVKNIKITFDPDNIFNSTSNFNFGENPDITGNKQIIDWDVSRTKTTTDKKTREIFIPLAECEDDKANNPSVIFRDSSLSGLSVQGINSDGTATITIKTNQITVCGKLFPGNENISLGRFINSYPDNDASAKISASDFVFTMRNLLSYTSKDGDKKIKGIPYSVEIEDTSSNDPLPTPYYDISAEVLIGNFKQKLDISQRENYGSGSLFNYVILGQ